MGEVIVVGELAADKVFDEIISETKVLEEITKEMANIGSHDSLKIVVKRREIPFEYGDEVARSSLEHFVADYNKSILIIGGKRSGKTTLMKRLIRKKAMKDVGLLVIDGVRDNYVEDATRELEDAGLVVGKDVSILATVTGTNAEVGLEQFVTSWKEHSEREEDGDFACPIDVVVLVEDNVVIGMFVVRNGEDGGYKLEPLIDTDYTVSISEGRATTDK